MKIDFVAFEILKKIIKLVTNGNKPTYQSSCKYEMNGIEIFLFICDLNLANCKNLIYWFI